MSTTNLTEAVYAHAPSIGYRMHEMSSQMTTFGALPPGTGKLLTIFSWVCGGVTLALLCGFVGGLGKSGLKALSHGQFEGGMGPAICLVCAVLAGAATAIFATLGLSTPSAS